MVTGLKPRGFVWVIAGRLATSERIGGHGFQHRRVRREEEVAWMRETAGITTVISMLPGAQNRLSYEAAGFRFAQTTVGEEVTPEVAQGFFETLAKALAEPKAVVLVHRDTIDDTVAGLLGGYLIYSGLLDDQVTAAAVIQEILGRALGPEGRALIPEPQSG